MIKTGRLLFTRAQRKLQQGPRQAIRAPGPAAPLHAQADGAGGLLTAA